MDEELTQTLNSSQIEAVTHPEGPLLVVAGAGTGKTRVITQRVAWLVEQGVPAWRIMAITFTNKAAREMQGRIWRQVNCPDVWVSTFHSMAARLLRIECGRLGYSSDFSIYDDDDSRRLVRDILKGMSKDGDGGDSASPVRIRNAISRAKSDMRRPDDLPSYTPFDLLVKGVYRQYDQTLHERNAMDFDDLLLHLLRILEDYPEVRDKYAGRFLHLLVDEFQDTNLPQYRIAALLASVHRNITVTGDPDQSIYSWRGARLDNILGFQKDFPDCKVVRLERNYRSVPQIIQVADAVIKNNAARLERSLFAEKGPGKQVEVTRYSNEAEEAAGVIETIKQTAGDSGRPYSDFGVLMRTNAQSQLFEEECIKNDVPYVIFGGTAFFQRREVKDMVAYLRLVVNPRDNGMLQRAVQVPPRGVGARTLEKLSRKAEESNTGMLDAIDGEFIAGIKGSAKTSLPEFMQLFKELMGMPLNPVKNVVKKVIEKSGYREYLEDRGEKERVENVDELIEVAARFDADNPEGGLREFLEMVSLLTDQDRTTEEETKGRILLMTLHSAKGLEFPVVYIVGLVEGKLPHQRSLQDSDSKGLEEERRLFYVGLTRAMEELHLTHYVRQVSRHMPGGIFPSRFLDELPGELIDEHDVAETAMSWTRPPQSWGGDGFPSRKSAGRGGGTGETPLPSEPIRVYDADFSEETGYQRGDRVLHGKFGVGTITDVKGDRVVVDFVRAGKKRLSTRFARLEKLG